MSHSVPGSQQPNREVVEGSRSSGVNPLTDPRGTDTIDNDVDDAIAHREQTTHASSNPSPDKDEESWNRDYLLSLGL